MLSPTNLETAARVEASSTTTTSTTTSRSSFERKTTLGKMASNGLGEATASLAAATASVHQNEVRHTAESHTACSRGSVTHRESNHVTQSTKKTSVTMKTKLNKRHSLLTSELTKTINTKMPLEELEKCLNRFDDLERITPSSDMKMVENTLVKYCNVMGSTVEEMKRNDNKPDMLCKWLMKLNVMMDRAWQVPSFGHDIGNTLSNILRKNGGLDLLIENCAAEKEELQFSCAKLLRQCILLSENRGYLVEKGLNPVLRAAIKYTDDVSKFDRTQVGTGILEHLFRHSEVTCSDVIALGGLDRVVSVCRSDDIETLRQCSSALANVAMYGGSENQEAMIQRQVPNWLFPLAFHRDDIIKYFACLAIAVLVANKEIEAHVQKTNTLELIDPFVRSHTPAEFAITLATHSHGQSPNWLKRLIPVLMSHREEARNIAAFHFCMEAEIKKQSGSTQILLDIGCVDSLRKLASGPNGLAAKYAAHTLRLLGEEVPHKLSQQVPTWSVEDVEEWVKQIGFAMFAESFEHSRVDGDLLLQLTEDMLRDDIEMKNGILRRRFMRELTNLKRMADYASCDPTCLNGFLTTLGQEFSVYTYEMLKAGIDKETLLRINEEQLLSECGITNKIHRLKILQGVKMERGEVSLTDDCSSLEKSLDVFISYRRSNGSQLASLLKVHLEIRNLSVFLDVDRLEAGKFDNNLLQSIRSARNFVLVLTPGALDRCMGDDDQRDWIHKEVACALNSDCNIIPVFDNFVMPEADTLPSTMRALCSYNGVKWIHDYQDACVDKIDRFIRGDNATISSGYGGVMMDRFMSGINSSVGVRSETSSVSGSNLTRQNTYQRTISNDSTKPPSATSSSDDPPNTSEKD